MPELPEAERARAAIAARGLGRRIASVDDRDTYVCRPHAPGEIDAALRGRMFTEALRRGKAFWLETDGGPPLGLHLGMTGEIVIDEEPSERGFDRFAITFEDGGRLALRDPRRLGRARLDPNLDHLGPDAAEIGRDEFRERVGRGAIALKARLMDQKTLAGAGNLIVDEALWRARLHPRRPAGELSTDELDRLRRAIRAVIRDSLRHGGTTGPFIAARDRNGACPRCGAPLESARIGGRTTYWCPAEQR
jgi:formamidopyrimidine-DNA glycosylase